MSDLLQDLLLADPQPEVAPLVVIDHLTKRYGRFVAVDNVSFQVRRGAIFGFVGPNGAGKTTTLKIMATLLEPTAGRVTLGGYEVTRRPAEVRNITGYMPDFFGVYDDLTVTEYLEFYARAQGVNLAAQSRLLSDLLSLVDLGHKRDAYVETLSRGMKQRLCLARCLVHDAQILLLDEPASGLDPRARVEMRELLKELQRMGKTIIVSSHILPELADLCTDIGIVDRGHFLAGGTVEEVIRRYGQRTILQIELTPENGHSMSSLLEKAVKVLQTQPGLPAGVTPTVDLAASRVSLPYVGSDSQLRQVLLALLRAGLPVIRFNLERGNLEDVFMAITTTRPAQEEDQS